MPSIFAGRPDEKAMWAAVNVTTELFGIENKFEKSDPDPHLIRTIAVDSVYRMVMSGSEEPTFIAHPEIEQQRPKVYKYLRELGLKAVTLEESTSREL